MTTENTYPSPVADNADERSCRSFSNSARSAQGEPARRLLTSAQLMFIAVVCLMTATLRLTELPLRNFCSMLALSLLCGSAIRHPAAVLLPLGVRLLTDVALHFKTGYGFFASWPFDYSAYLFIWVLGRRVDAGRMLSVGSGTVASIVIYFVMSNFGVWLLWPETYPKTAAGLLDCFTMAIPFAGGTVAGNLIAAPLFFVTWRYVSTLNAATKMDDSLLQPERVSTTNSGR